MLQEAGILCESSYANNFLSASTASGKYGIAVHEFTPESYLTTVSGEFTLDGYRIETVARIVYAKNSPAAKKFNSAKEFLVWLKNYRKK